GRRGAGGGGRGASGAQRGGGARLDRARRPRAAFGGGPARRHRLRPKPDGRLPGHRHGQPRRAARLSRHRRAVTLLTVRGLSAFYGDFQALFDISLDVTEGETVAVIGANGAGKTTFLRALAGALAVPRGAVQFA